MFPKLRNMPTPENNILIGINNIMITNSKQSDSSRQRNTLTCSDTFAEGKQVGYQMKTSYW